MVINGEQPGTNTPLRLQASAPVRHPKIITSQQPAGISQPGKAATSLPATTIISNKLYLRSQLPQTQSKTQQLQAKPTVPAVRSSERQVKLPGRFKYFVMK